MTNFKSHLNVFTFFCFILVLTRMLYAENIKFIFLIWNIFLGWIPFICSSYVLKNIDKKLSFKNIVFILLSIAFLPNAVYLITDLIHLKPRTDVALWYDAILLFCFSLLGLIYSTISLINMERISKYCLPKKWVLPLMLFLIFGSGYGVYLGRVLRWNSWDALVHPFQILMDTLYCVFRPFQNKLAWLMTILFASIQAMFWSMFRTMKFESNSQKDSKS